MIYHISYMISISIIFIFTYMPHPSSPVLTDCGKGLGQVLKKIHQLESDIWMLETH
jgi:hypothetical protein